MICALLANIHRDPKRRSQPFTPDDFMPQRANKPAQTPEQMVTTVTMLNTAFGGNEVIRDA